MNFHTCIIRSFPEQSQTFIDNHVQRLPDTVSEVAQDRDGQWNCRLKGRVLSGDDLEHILTELKPDVLLAEFGMIGLSAFEASQKLGIPLVIHFHGYDAFRSDVLDRYEHEYRRVLPHVRATIGVSRNMCRQLQNLGASSQTIFHSPCGVDTSQWSRPSSTVYPSGLKAVTVSRLVPKKGVQLTIQSFSKFVAQNPSTESHLTIIGEGPLKSQCMETVRAQGLADKVSFKGWLPPKEIRKSLLVSNTFVQHSITSERNDREGTPVAILEAQSIGLPVVSTLHEGISEAVEHGKSGLLGPQGDPDKMATNLEMITRGNLFKMMGERGAKRMKERYSLDLTISRLHSILYWAHTDKKKPALS